MAKPVVNGIEQDLGENAEVIRINMLTSLGQQLSKRFEVVAVPTTVVLSGTGDIVYQHSGIPNRETVVGHALA